MLTRFHRGVFRSVNLKARAARAARAINVIPAIPTVQKTRNSWWTPEVVALAGAVGGGLNMGGIYRLYRASEETKKLYRLKADVETIINDIKINGMNPLQTAIMQGNTKDAELLIRTQGCNLDAPNNYKRTALHLAVAYENEDLIELLIREGASINKPDINLHTPLHRCVANQSRRILTILLELIKKYKPAELSAAVNAQDNGGYSALHMAAYLGDLEIINLLLQNGASKTVTIHQGKTPYDIARDFGRLEAARILHSRESQIDHLENGHERFFQLSQEDAKKVINAIEQGSKEHMEQLERDGFNFSEVRDKNENTLLHIAIDAVEYPEKESILNKLIAHKIDVNAQNNEGKTALHLIASKISKDSLQLYSPIVDALLARRDTNIEAKDNFGNTVLHLAVTCGNSTLVEKLIKAGADVNATNKNSWTPLHIAVVRGNNEILKILMKNNANLDVRVDDGWRPLHFGVINEASKDCVETLLSNSLTMVDSQEDKGETALHKAVRAGNIKIVELLITHNADVSKRDYDGMLPVDYAVNKKNPDIIAILRSPDNFKCIEQLKKEKKLHNDTKEQLRFLGEEHSVLKKENENLKIEQVRISYEEESGHNSSCRK